MGYYDDVLSGIADLASGIILLTLIGLAIYYVLTGLILKKFVEKTGRIGDGWMAFVPFVRDYYTIKMLNLPWWHLFFFGSCGNVISSIIIAFGYSSLDAYAAAVTISSIYSLGVTVYTCYVWSQIYKEFSMHPAIGFFFGYTWVLQLVVVTTPAIRWRALAEAEARRAAQIQAQARPKTMAIVGICGELEGNEYPVAAGRTVMIGRDESCCNIIFSSANVNVSRQHCSVRYDEAFGKFYVTDFSKNGTYFSNGTRLMKGVATPVAVGQTIYLGSKEDKIRLGNTR